MPNNSTPPPTDALSELMEAHGKATREVWQEGVAGQQGVVSYDGDDITFVASAKPADRRFIILAHNSLPAIAESYKATTGELRDVKVALNKIHSWLVCAAIASNDDMAQSFEEMEQVARVALGLNLVTEGVIVNG